MGGRPRHFAALQPTRKPTQNSLIESGDSAMHPTQLRIERWQRMMDVITREDIGWWRKTFTEALMEAPLEMEAEAEPA